MAAAAQIVPLETSGEIYHVFLSFRGPDTRDGFTNCLFEFLKDAGLHVFMDDEELRVGESIAGEIQRAIYDSKLFIPIFSRGYASSKWCLKEIAWMADCMEKFPGKKEMLPVFYDAGASDVKLKTDLYAKDLFKHEKTCGRETVERWRKALIKVPEVKGWNLKDTKGEGKLIKLIAQHISRRVELKHRILPNQFIGMEEQIQDVTNALDCGSSDVRIVVIHGMGGIGKTTLAGAVFNKIFRQFQGCSFLSNVRKSSAGNGIVNLQNQLLGDTLRFSPHNFCDENDAMICIQRSLKDKHVLVVLDDVSDTDQIRKLIGMGDWVGLGSRVIITTRNLNCIANVEEIENEVMILQRKKIYIYQMRELGFNDSLKLLCQHAFGQYVPPHGYEQLSRDILSLTRGIPLALEVIGSLLKGDDSKRWEYILSMLKEVPDDRLYQEILMTSYKALSYEEKEIFLDIAFFFSGYDKLTVSHYWEACKLFPEIRINTLVSYALVKIDDSNRIWMHDLLKDLGREVVREQSIENLERRSRLCNEDAKALLLRRKGTETVKSLKLDSNHTHNFTPVELSRLYGLRLLELCGGNFIGKFDRCLSELRWLSWKDCPQRFQGTNFCFKNLVVLRLSSSNVTDTWAGWGQFKMAKNLKVLEIEDLNLTTTSELTSFLSLERLVIRQHRSLVHIDTSIGSLKCLDSLEIFSFQYMSEDIRPDEVVHLPSSICNLKALTRLRIEGLTLKELPEEIAGLKSLKTLQIIRCELLRNLPNSISDLKSLCELVLTYNGITELPESIGKLGSLTKLDVSNNQLRRLPATIGDLGKLETLDSSYNKDLEGEIPSEFVKLQSLRSLDLSLTMICRLPTRIVQLSRLDSLLLGYCDKIQELPDLPASLTRLKVSSKSLKAVPDLSSLTSLVYLELSNDCYWINDWDIPRLSTRNKMTWIQQLQKLEDLTMDLPQVLPYLSTGLDRLSRLRRLRLACRDPSLMSFPSGLESLEILHANSLSHWEWLSSLQGLSTLVLCKSNAMEIRLDGLELLKNLTKLTISECRHLQRVHDISGLQKLQYLRLSDCPKLVEIGGLAQPPDSLQYLVIDHCFPAKRLPAQSSTQSPRKLHLEVRYCCKYWKVDVPHDSYVKCLAAIVPWVDPSAVQLLVDRKTKMIDQLNRCFFIFILLLFFIFKFSKYYLNNY